MWSASSSTVICSASSVHSRWSMRSCSRPGVATDDVDAAAELVDLAAHRGAAVDGGDLQVERLRERREGVADLLGELAGRHQDQAAGGAPQPLAADQAGQHRQAEGQRLARAGGAAAEHVAAGQRVGDGAGLDGEGGGHAAAGQRGDQPVRQAERGEGRLDVRGRSGRVGGCVEGELEVGAHRRGRRAGGGAATRRAAATGGRGAARGAEGRPEPGADERDGVGRPGMKRWAPLRCVGGRDDEARSNWPDERGGATTERCDRREVHPRW
jgi:hypothetical protein